MLRGNYQKRSIDIITVKQLFKEKQKYYLSKSTLHWSTLVLKFRYYLKISQIIQGK